MSEKIEEDLNAIFRQIGLEWKHLALVNVWIMRLTECFLQLFHLILSENCPTDMYTTTSRVRDVKIKGTWKVLSTVSSDVISKCHCLTNRILKRRRSLSCAQMINIYIDMNHYAIYFTPLFLVSLAIMFCINVPVSSTYDVFSSFFSPRRRRSTVDRRRRILLHTSAWRTVHSRHSWNSSADALTRKHSAVDHQSSDGVAYFIWSRII